MRRIKIIFLFFFFLPAAGFCQPAEKPFTLRGQIANPRLDSVSLEYISDQGKYIHEVLGASNGKFLFRGVLKEPCFALLLFIHKGEHLDNKSIETRRNYIYIEPGSMEINTEAQGSGYLAIQGSKTQDEWNELKTLTQKLQSRDSLAAVNYAFFLSHPNSYVTADRIRYYTAYYSLDSLQRIYDNFDKTLKGSVGGGRLAAEIRSQVTGRPGTMANVFTVPDKEGRTLSLSDFKGKYVLLDFWATWCVPCRASMPGLVRLYEKYKDKNFDVIAIGDDDTRVKEWITAIDHDGTGSFHHVLRGVNMELSRSGKPNPRDLDELYGVKALPTQILIDPDGKIIGRFNGNDEEMEKKLTSLLQPYTATIQGRIEQMLPGTRISYQWYDIDHISPNFDNADSVFSTKEGFTIHLNVGKGEGNQLMVMIGKTVATDKLLILYVDKGLITIHSKDSLFTHVTLDGSPFAQDLNEIHQLIESNLALEGYYEVRGKALRAKGKTDSVSLVYIARLKEMDSVKKAVCLHWISEHPNSPIGAFIMGNVLEPLYGKLNSEEKKAVLDGMTPAARDNKVAAALLYSLKVESMAAIGQKAPDFTQGDTLGNPVSLKDFRGKYVLLDFWASWCGPCRKENPNVLKCFNKYKEKGFTVLGVSLDQPGKKMDWLKAIHDDHLAWTQVSDLKYWANGVAKLYDINAVPANFLIGPDGTILAKNIKGDDLEKELEKVLPQ